MAEGAAGEGTAGGDEVVETAVVPNRHQRIPQLLEPGRVAGADRVLDGGEAGTLLQRLAPGIANLVEQRRQVLESLDIDRLALEIDHRTGGVRLERVGERHGLEADAVAIVEEGPRGDGKAHAAQLAHHAVGPLEGLRAQAAADPARLVDHGLEAEAHQLVGRDHAGSTRPRRSRPRSRGGRPAAHPDPGDG